MIDVLYLVGNSSRCNNNELRLSLRSLDNFGRNIGKIYVLGLVNEIDWLTDDVTKIQVDNISDDKIQNINNCILEFMKITDRDFVLMYDDFILVKELDFEKIGYNINEKLWYKYSTRSCDLPMIYTYFMCMFYSHRLNNYETCFPFRFEYNKLKALIPAIESSQVEPCKAGVHIKSLYGNIYNLPNTDYYNRKLWTLDSTILLKQYLRDYDVSSFSVSSEVMQQGMLQFLYNMFPKLCKYERI